MAEGALKRSMAHIAIAITGFAGPAGPGQRRAWSTSPSPAAAAAPSIAKSISVRPGVVPVRVKSLKVMLEMLEQALEEA